MRIMNKNYIIALLLVIIAVGAYLFIVDSDDVQNNRVETVSTDSADYKACVELGGETVTEIAPSTCVLDGKSYSDGNF